MQYETMTVHEALCTLKMLDKRIPAAIAELNPVLCNKHINTRIDGKTIKEVENGIKDEFKSEIPQLVANFYGMKGKIEGMVDLEAGADFFEQILEGWT